MKPSVVELNKVAVLAVEMGDKITPLGAFVVIIPDVYGLAGVSLALDQGSPNLKGGVLTASFYDVAKV